MARGRGSGQRERPRATGGRQPGQRPQATAAAASGGGGGIRQRGWRRAAAGRQPAAGAAVSGGAETSVGGEARPRAGCHQPAKGAAASLRGGGQRWGGNHQQGRRPAVAAASDGGAGCLQRGRRQASEGCRPAARSAASGRAAVRVGGGKRWRGGFQKRGRLPAWAAPGDEQEAASSVGGHEWRQRGSQWHGRWLPRGGSQRDGR